MSLKYIIGIIHLGIKFKNNKLVSELMVGFENSSLGHMTVPKLMKSNYDN
jgi:hypothetical protein